MENYKKISNLMDYQAKTLVGILLKRIDLLSEQKLLTPELYKSLIKENIYEQFRNIKQLLEVYLTVGTVEFKSKPKV